MSASNSVEEWEKSASPDKPRAPLKGGLPAIGFLEIVEKPEALAILLVAIAAAFRVRGSVDPDVSWQLWTAQRAHHGARLYRDIADNNPPLWYWMARPIDRLGGLIGVRTDAVMILAIAAFVAISIIATAKLIRHIPERPRRMLLVYAAAILFGMSWMHIGQREQIVLIGVLPYIALIAARQRGATVNSFLAVGVGAGAALGFALKHYFLLVPALLELCLYFGRRSSWRPLRPETLAVMAIGVAYALSVLIWARDFFTTALPMTLLAYGATGAPHFVDLFQPPILIALLIVGFILTHYRLNIVTQAPLATALLIGGSGFAAAYFIQHKGWFYHSIPFVGCASLALAALLAETSELPASLRLLGPALLALPLATAVQEWRTEKLPTPEMLHSVAGLSPGDRVGFLATDPAIAWSVTLQHHLRYASRYSSYWMLRAIVRNELQGDPNPKLEKLRQEIVDETVADFRCMAPRRIIVTRPGPHSQDSETFDILPFFLKDAEFARMFAHYRPISRGDTLELYDIAVPLERPNAMYCRRGV